MKETIIFDVDGTLYNQVSVRMAMALELGQYYFLHWSKIKYLLATYKFRKYREEEKYNNTSIDELCKIIGNEKGLDPSTVKETIDYWMFHVPLKYIKKFKRDNVLDYMQMKRQQGCTIVIYSDYPAEEKLEVLGVVPDYIFYPSAETFNELKPSKKAMDYILMQCGADENNIIFIGDRTEKDGESARLVGAHYIDVKKLKGRIF